MFKITINFKDPNLVRQSRIFKSRNEADLWFDEKVEEFKAAGKKVKCNTYAFFENDALIMYKEDIYEDR